MKSYLRRILACALSVSILCALTVPAAASVALGDDLTSRETLVNYNTQLSTNVFWSNSFSDLRTENVVTYTPNSSVKPMVTYGSVLTSCNTISSMAKQLESQGYRVVAGINGDFYNVNNGLPIGIVVKDGELKSTDGGYWGIGFRGDGTAVLGKPTVKVTADLGYELLDSAEFPTRVVRNIIGVNKARVATGGIYLYTHDFNSKHTTGTTDAGVDVVCTIESGSLAMNGEPLTLKVDSVLTDAKGTAIPEGKVVLSANNQADVYYLNAMKNIPLGATLTLNVTPSNASWNDVQFALGALYSLVENGAVSSGLAKEVNPRTAVGQKADGTLVFYTIDGRRSGHSIGASMTQVAQRLIEMGCVTALCLDGGGSTTLTVTSPDATTAKTVNRPSGGSERAVSNQIFLVATNQPTGQLGHFYVSADNQYVLAGSAVKLSASPVDTNFIPMSSADYTLSSSAGTIKDNVLTTPSEGGDVTVTASGSGQTGTTVVHAVKTPDSIAVKNGSTAVTTLNVAPGGSVTLTASAIYKHLPLKADPAAFTWSVDGNIGTVDNTGKFTASAPGSGTLTVSAGGKSVSVKMTVSEIPLSTLEGFENGAPAITEYSYGATLSANTDTNYVRYGRASGKLDYTLDASGMSTAMFTTPYAVGAAYSQLNLWVWGDKSNNTLRVLVSDGTNITELDVGVLNFSGWQQMVVALPTGTASIAGFKIAAAAGGTVTMEDGSEQINPTVPAGTVYLDQMVASYNNTVDNVAPVVTASLSGTSLTATITDKGDKFPVQSGVSVTMDGKTVAFTYDAKKGTVSSTLPIADTNAHRVTVTAKDASGNMGRASCDVKAAAGAPQFTDTTGYWAGSYVDWLKSSGITTGYEDGSFRPNLSITRQQFAVMLYRYLGIDGTKYEQTVLPFEDESQIADYAKTAIKALYATKILNGSEVNGKIYFYPGSSLTRAQAATMIGRTQERGYATTDLTFTDGKTIPAYAMFYIQTMSAQKVISGYEDGSFRPNANITRGQMAKILYNLL